VIDVWEMVANSVWILGLAVLLAAFSWASWTASAEGNRFRTALRRPGIQRVLSLGLMLFCAGLAATGHAWWERTLWGLLTVIFAVQAWLMGQVTKTTGGGDDGE
jgi:hypothetical protein